MESQSVNKNTKRLALVSLWLGYFAIIGVVGNLIIIFITLSFYFGSRFLYDFDLMGKSAMFIFYSIVLGIPGRFIGQLTLKRINKEGDNSDPTITKMAKRGILLGSLALIVPLLLFSSVVVLMSAT